MKQHFVTFLSPGTFVNEETTRPIQEWDTEAAVEMAREIKERHSATPYAFFFTTRERSENELDSKVTERSAGIYFLGGRVLTLADIEARNEPEKDRILISNMRNNGYGRVIENCNSWKITVPLRDEDTVLPIH